MSKKRYYITADLDYIQGHLRWGHLEGTVELTDEELARLKKDPQFAKKLGLDTKVDDYEVDDVGDVDSITVFEVDEEGITQREIDMTDEKEIADE
jgi:hypothetical protein